MQHLPLWILRVRGGELVHPVFRGGVQFGGRRGILPALSRRQIQPERGRHDMPELRAGDLFEPRRCELHGLCGRHRFF